MTTYWRYEGVRGLDAKAVKAVIRVLKRHFTNVSAERAVDISIEILEALEEAKKTP